jgi:hypothetical protein
VIRLLLRMVSVVGCTGVAAIVGVMRLADWLADYFDPYSIFAIWSSRS